MITIYLLTSCTYNCYYFIKVTKFKYKLVMIKMLCEKFLNAAHRKSVYE